VTALVFAGSNSIWALEQPVFGASGPELLTFYGDLSTRIVIGGTLALLSVATFVVFASALRGILVELEGDEILANVAFGGTLLGVAAGTGAETVNMAAALRAGDGELTVPLAQALFDTSYVLGFNAAGIGIGLLALATSVVALRSGTLIPRWLAVVGILLGMTLLTPISVYTLPPAFIFLLALGLSLLRGSGMQVPDARTSSS